MKSRILNRLLSSIFDLLIVILASFFNMKLDNSQSIKLTIIELFQAIRNELIKIKKQNNAQNSM